MKKGIVMDINSRFVTLLTPDGQFLKAYNEHGSYSVGEEISFNPVPEGKRIGKVSLPRRRSAVLLSAAAVFLLMLGLLPMFSSKEASAYMTLDVNPSFELSLDDELKVINLHGLNGDGKKLAARLASWKDKSVQKVMDIILTESRKSGFLQDEDEIILAAVPLDDSKELQSRLNNSVKKTEAEIKKEIPSSKVTSIKATPADRTKAKEKGVSTGVYMKKREDKKTDKPKDKTPQASMAIENGSPFKQDKPPVKRAVPKAGAKQQRPATTASKSKQNPAAASKNKQNPAAASKNKQNPAAANKNKRKLVSPPAQEKAHKQNRGHKNKAAEEKKPGPQMNEKVVQKVPKHVSREKHPHGLPHKQILKPAPPKKEKNEKAKVKKIKQGKPKPEHPHKEKKGK
ncbi:anti-sigma factor domain-containing protein [Peribacillus sp. SCS-37]|uniref:anti-sigma factor domain-containing protein n=1 Tax=Paraperibacillus esterisolvens TaxID=3115296 RepID=UPI003905AFF8